MNVAKKTRPRILGLGVSIVAGFVMASGAAAWTVQPEPKTTEPAKPAAALPKGEEILDRFVKETGGKEAYESIKSVVLTGQMTLMMNMKGELKVYVKDPGKLFSKVTIENLGEMKSGSDGETVWSENPFEGPKILEGVEKEMTMESSHIGEEANWRERFKDVKCVGEEAIDGKPAYKVEMTTKDGQKRTSFYDKENGLLVKQSMVVSLPQGEIPTEILVSDYKKVGNLLFPHKSKTTVMTQEMTTVFEKIELNADVPDSTFELPAEIKELRDKKAKKAEEPKAPAPAPKGPEKK
jgi:zinc protease